MTTLHINKTFIVNLIAIVNITALCSCDPAWDIDYDMPVPQEIVVEGEIENGGFAKVILSRTIGLEEQFDSLSVVDSTIRWAKVSVSDGEQTEILTGRLTPGQIPPFIYTGNTIRGIPGKTYTLTVEYSGRTLSATTTIPDPVDINRITVEKSSESDTLYQVKIHFTDTDPAHNYYKIFTQVRGRDSRFFSSFMGIFDDTMLDADGSGEVSAYRSFKHTDLDHYTPFFSHRDTVTVKFTQIPRDGFLFWSDYENEVTNGKNPIFPSMINLQGNISGGMGIWCGYGQETRTICIPDSIKP